MEKFDIIFNSNEELIQKYEGIEKVYLEKFKYFMMLIKYSKSKILEVKWNNINAMKDILDTIKRTSTDDISRQKSDITFDEYNDALNYLGCNISVFNFYLPFDNEYDIFSKCKSDAELSYFVLKFDNISEDIKSYFGNRIINTKTAINDYYREMVLNKNYSGLEYLLTDIPSYDTCFREDIPDLSFLMDCDEGFADKYPAIWWVHLLITKNLEGQEKYMDTIVAYSKKFVEYSYDLISQIPDNMADKFLTKYDFLDELVFPKISIKLLEKLYENKEYNIRLLDFNQVVELFIRSNNIKLVREAAIYLDVCADPTDTFKKYSEKEIENRFNFLLERIKDISWKCSFVRHLKDANIPGSYSFWINNTMYSCRELKLSKNNPSFKFSENFFEFFSETKELHKIGSAIPNKTFKLFLKTDYSFLQCNSKFVCKIAQPKIVLGPEISTDDINLFDRKIEQMFVSKNMIILEPYGHIKVLDHSSISFYTKLNNFNLFYFANNQEEKIVLVYNNKIKIYKAKNMFYYALYVNKAFYKFIEQHANFEL